MVPGTYGWHVEAQPGTILNNELIRDRWKPSTANYPTLTHIFSALYSVSILGALNLKLELKDILEAKFSLLANLLMKISFLIKEML